ncbi:hypothetical protein JTB14_032919 [Gonioctena quinquepunctata]|nr:hypothetical protein JTB14_032919 [Gonioctena quinquepunctata]
MKCLKINFRASDRCIVCGESAIEIITEAILPVADFNIENGIEDAEIIFEDIGRSMTPPLSTTSSLSTLSNHSVIREGASPESDDIQECIVRGDGQYIIDQYNKNKMLTDRCRIQLVNIVANILFEKIGTAVPKSAKMGYAKKLVEAFPTYRNLESSCGGYSFNAAHLGGARACEAGFHPITPRRHDINKENNEERNLQRRKKTTKKETFNEEGNHQRRKKPTKKTKLVNDEGFIDHLLFVPQQGQGSYPTLIMEFQLRLQIPDPTSPQNKDRFL